ncbi:MAG: hypothetical protein IKV03_03595 [Alphaproteobacteria bacterium]|nr:hypothetical protein [Alphaproteobacteria bacterium]
MAKNHYCPSGYHWVCRPYIHRKDGTILYASQYGKKAFCFLVPDEK